MTVLKSPIKKRRVQGIVVDLDRKALLRQISERKYLGVENESQFIAAVYEAAARGEEVLKK